MALETKYDPGKMDERVAVNSYTNTMSSDFGGIGAKTKTVLRTVWAEVEAGTVAKNAEKYTDDMTQSGRSRISIRMRYASDVTVEHTVTWDGTEYDILSVTKVGRKQFMILDCLAHGTN